MAVDLRPAVGWVLDVLEPSVRVDYRAGAYAGSPGGTQVELYGSADLACVLHTVGALAPSPAERGQWVAVLESFQEPGNGGFREPEPTHDALHNTAFAIGALELLGHHVTEPPAFAEEYRSPAAAVALLDGLDWAHSVWGDSHRGAGLGAVFAMMPGLAAPGWFDAWFADLDARFDPATGMLGTGRPPEGDVDQIGGTFHYHFLYEWAHRPMPHPDARVDAVLGLQQPDGRWFELSPYWLTLDAVYLLTRTVGRTPHRNADVTGAVRRAAAATAADLGNPAVRAQRFGGPLGVHELTAALSILAEAQSHLGSTEIVTDRPLRLVLDRHPFI